MFEQRIKNFNINFNGLNERNSFSSGDLITGHISFDLTKETKLTSITVRVSGKANVHWSTGGGGGRKRKSHRRHFYAKLDFFDYRSVLLQETNAVDGTVKLQPGTHMYPITCQLPHGNFPTSFRGVHGQILYTLTVGINRPWHLSKDFVTELNFVNHTDTNRPDLPAPLSGTNNMTLCCLWCASGPITMTARTEKKAFVPGETVKLICDFSNPSSRTATPKVKLQQRQTFYTLNKVHKRMFSKYLASVTGQPIGPQTCDVHTEIRLTIPSAAALTISNCSILDVDYLVEVNLSVRAAPDLTVLFPIILCDTPVQPHPPPYLS